MKTLNIFLIVVLAVTVFYSAAQACEPPMPGMMDSSAILTVMQSNTYNTVIREGFSDIESISPSREADSSVVLTLKNSCIHKFKLNYKPTGEVGPCGPVQKLQSVTTTSDNCAQPF